MTAALTTETPIPASVSIRRKSNSPIGLLQKPSAS
jgi:hypothetical protein